MPPPASPASIYPPRPSPLRARPRHAAATAGQEHAPGGRGRGRGEARKKCSRRRKGPEEGGFWRFCRGIRVQGGRAP
eukprot:scaffold1634_cov353-Prasinococcus_capsulatus_cf.AAC.13